MTDTRTAQRGVQGITIRSYRPSDHNACRALWAELIEHRGRLHGESPRGGRDRDAGPDAGAGFEEYLTQLNLSGMWVADHTDTGVVGFVGLMLDGRSGEVDPVVVTADFRGRGIGRSLLAKVAEEAGRRGLRRLTVSPAVRDRAALQSLHTAGFSTIATVTLAYDLAGAAAGRSEPEGETLDLYDLRFSV
jgi:GNAT superfamily N-acetyltransferase